jgi:ABC-type antimicrobial peptide transport system permease subunit
MVKNFLKITFRNLKKNKAFLVINVAGLSLALACCIVAYLNTSFAHDFDKNHENIKQIYKVHSNKEVQGKYVPYGITPLALGPAIANDIADISKVIRYTHSGMTIKDKGNDKVLNKTVGFADPEFLNAFTFPLISGEKNAFQKKESIMITQKTAITYFGNQDPLGQILTVIENGKTKNYIVNAVFENIPQNTSIQFDALLSFDNYEEIYELESNDWKRFLGGTFLYIENPSALKNIESLLSKYIPLQNNARKDWVISKFELVSMVDHAQTSNDIRADWFWNAPNPAAVIAPPIMAFLILLIACFNFTNTSISSSNRRLKEIGIRKVMGSNKWQLIIQFMTENLIVVFLAILFSILLATYMVPAYSAMWEGMTLELNFMENQKLFGFLFGLMIFTAVLAGAYPALYISSYEPVKILRGSLKIGSTSVFSKILLGLQYTFTVLALFASIAFLQNAKYQDEVDMGFNKDQVVGVRIENATDFKKMKDAFDEYPNFSEVAGTGEHIGRWNYSRTLKSESKEIEADMMDFGAGYFEVMDLKLIEGRGFKKDLIDSDRTKSIVINETLANHFGWEAPLGKKLALNDTTSLTVIGVVKDFFINGFWEPVGPTAIRAESEEARFNCIGAKVSNDKIVEAFEHIEAAWAGNIPDKEFTGFYQEDLLKESKVVNKNIVIIFSFLGALAVILSGIGLYTLVSLNLIRRVKEIGVRKVLGGSIQHIIQLINKDYVLLLVLSSISGVIAGYFVIDLLIATIFANYKAIDGVTIGIPIFLILFVSLSISTVRIFSAAIRNPIESLRYE